MDSLLEMQYEDSQNLVDFMAPDECIYWDPEEYYPEDED